MIACEDTRRTRALLSAHEIPAPGWSSATSAGSRASPMSWPRWRPRASAWRSSATQARPRWPTRGATSCARARRRRAAHGAARASAVTPRSSPAGWPPRASRSGAGCRGAAPSARAGSSGRGRAAARGGLRVAEPPAATLAARARAGAPGGGRRELSKLHEEVVRGTPPEVAARGSARCAARSCWSSPPAAGGPSGAGEAAHEAVGACASWSGSASRAARARSCPG